MTLETPRQDLVDEVNAALRGYQRVTDAIDDAAAARFGINRTDLRCLDLLFDGSRSAGQLAEGVGLSPGAMTAALDRLEAKGHVRRVRDPADRRRVLVEMTDAARTLAWQVYGPIAEDGAADLAAYTDEQLALIRDFLREGRELGERHLARIRSDHDDGPTSD
jgi:DNA-binding MarR family transcriptional regulator